MGKRLTVVFVGRNRQGRPVGLWGLHSGPNLGQIWVPVWVIRSYSIFLSLSLVRSSVVTGCTTLNQFFLCLTRHFIHFLLTAFSKRAHLTTPVEIATSILPYPPPLSPQYLYIILTYYNNLLIISIICLSPLEHKHSKNGNIYCFYSLTSIPSA